MSEFRDPEIEFLRIAANLSLDPAIATAPKTPKDAEDISRLEDIYKKSLVRSRERRLERAAKMNTVDKLKYHSRSLKALAAVMIATSVPIIYAGARNVANETQALACPTTVKVTVGSGDTVWNLVTKENSKDIDPRALVDEFRKLNESTTIHTGSQVQVPICNK